MQVRVLGCSGGIAAHQHTTSFLVDDDVLIDAGTGVTTLAVSQMQAIDHVFLTHAHLDHILCLPLMADSAGAKREQPICVYGLPATLAALRRHVLNDHIWPDFTRLPSAERPLIRLMPVQVGQRVELRGKTIEVLPAVHNVPAVGYAVLGCQPSRPAWVFSGDTGPNQAFWERVLALNVQALVIETAFGDQEQHLAELSGHMTPGALVNELAPLAGRAGFPIYISHTKPQETDAIMRQLRTHLQANPDHFVDLRWLQTGDVFEL